MKNLDTIDIQFRFDDEDGHYAVLVLNGVDVGKPFSLILFVAADKLRHVEYEILTCSCGNAGCANIFTGTKVKRRGHTVEWRDVDSGLPKRFYAFDRDAYDAVTKNALDRMVEIVTERENLPEDLYDFSGQIYYERLNGFRGLRYGLEHSRNWLIRYASK